MNLIEEINTIADNAKTDPFAAARQAINLLEKLHATSDSYGRSHLNRSLESFKDGIENLQKAIIKLHSNE
jgi:hypothetical protein